MYERGILLDGRTSEADPERRASGLVLPPGMAELADIERYNWKAMRREIRDSGVPVMSAQGWRQLYPNRAEPPLENQTEVAAAETDTILWDPAGKARQTAIPANYLEGDNLIKITAGGVNTTAVTAAQTAIFTPRFGTTASGTGLGVSRTNPVVAEVLTNVQWRLEMVVHFRKIGTGGEAVCVGEVTCRSLIGTAATTNNCPVNFGTAAGTATAVDTTVAAGLLVSIKTNLSTNKWTTMLVYMESLN
jgi:hypothetical protein